MADSRAWKLAITLSGAYGDSAALQATARASMVGVPIAVGLYAMRHAASARKCASSIR